MYKKIIIFGHAGRGKSTFAEALSRKLSIPYYSTDDFFYKTKFTEAYSKEESVENIKKVYATDSWIMEGTTSRLIRPGIEKADVVFVLKFKNIISQYYFIIKRSFSRRHESIKNTWGLLKHVTRKRYMKGYGSNLPTTEELKASNKQVIELNSMRDIQKYLNSIV